MIAQVLKPAPKALLWVGHLSTFFRLVSALLPRLLRDLLLSKRFQLDGSIALPPAASGVGPTTAAGGKSD